MFRRPSDRTRRGKAGGSPSGNGSSGRSSREWLREQTPRGGPAPTKHADRRSPRRSRDGSRRGGPGLLGLVRLASYALLLFLTVQVGIMAWQAVDSRRLELFKMDDSAETPYPRLPVLPGGQESWADASLAASVQKGISSQVGTTAVYIKSLNTGATAAVRENTVFPSASLFKVPILVEVLRQQTVGLFNMDTKVRLQQKHWADGAGVLQARIGEELPVRELVDLMIRVSDNVAALALLDLVETDNVNLTLEANGLRDTRLRIGEMKRDWGGKPGENSTTAREMGLLLEKVATGGVLNEKQSEEAVRILSLEQQASWLPALLPPRVKVAHKSGELTNIRHDAGVVYGPRGQFVAVVLTSDFTHYDAAADTIARVARSAYDYLETGQGR